MTSFMSPQCKHHFWIPDSVQMHTNSSKIIFLRRKLHNNVTHESNWLNVPTAVAPVRRDNREPHLLDCESDHDKEQLAER